MTFYDELARTLKLRLITPDRPGVGESESVPDRLQNPLTWVDDVAVICSTLDISRFSLLAHSAGSIYALATALKMPQFVRGRIHLLAPWIPPSQMPKGAAIGPDSQPVANLPMAHRVLSLLPASMLKVANSKFLSATTVTGDAKAPKSKKLRNTEGLDYIEKQFMQSYTDLNDPSVDSVLDSNAENPADRTRNVSCYQANNDSLGVQGAPPSNRATPSPSFRDGSASPRLPSDARTALYNSALTHRIWALATLNANPAIDLLTCLERRKPIGFRYAEVTRSIVIRHGAKDSRVPLDNVRWLQSIMKRCELRVLEEEGHSLMASASVMSSVLSEIAREWDEWERIARDKEKRKRGANTSGKENKPMSLRSLGTITVKS
jgi:pimeloyl-ACP methyl ester carboxylesterase